MKEVIDMLRPMGIEQSCPLLNRSFVLYFVNLLIRLHSYIFVRYVECDIFHKYHLPLHKSSSARVLKGYIFLIRDE